MPKKRTAAQNEALFKLFKHYRAKGLPWAHAWRRAYHELGLK